MKVKTMHRLNLTSAVSFFVSALALFFVPFLFYKETTTALTYIVPAVFWAGLLFGLTIQIKLFVDCKKQHLKGKDKKYLGLLVVAAISFALTIIISLINSTNIVLFGCCLFVFFISLTYAMVIKREGYLR